MCRTVTLVLVDARGGVLGTLPPFEVPEPWWQEAASVVAGALERYGVRLAVLRLFATERSRPHGGAVTYVAEYESGPLAAARPAAVTVAAHPLRAAYAEPGGPAASVAWAAKELASLGWGPVVAAQRRTWNLSAIWRLDGDRGTAWLKQVPPFFAHEPAVLRWLATVAPERAPRLLAADATGRMLLAHAPGEDLYDAPESTVTALVDDLHDVQRAGAAAVGTLLAAGIPDGRWPALTRNARDTAARDTAARDTAARHGAGLALDDLLDALPERLAAIDACGLPDTLVHGDFHSGNARGDATGRTLLDWGDAFVGHPAFDVLRVVETQSPEVGGRVLAHWAARWRAAVPGSTPERAVELLKPVAALRNASAYDRFVRNIEPSERPHHTGDVGFWLREAAGA
jgi:hypothetical protein